MDSIDKILAANIRDWRKSRGLTQEQLAERANLSVQAIHSVENCKRWPEIGTVEALSNALDIPPAMLFNSAFGGLKRPPIRVDEALEVLIGFVKDQLNVSGVKRDMIALITSLDDSEVAAQLERLRAEILAPEFERLKNQKKHK